MKIGSFAGTADTALRRFRHRPALSLMELMATLAILGVLATLIIPRIGGHLNDAKAAACHANQGEIEIQTQLWRHDKGSFPNASLSNIGADNAYFPEGTPTCPVDGSSYTIDTATGRVLGHDH